MTVFFTADLHLGHENIIRYCKRPFANSAEMDEVLLENVLATVNKRDCLYILGDFCLSAREFARHELRLRARIPNLHFVKGNHDPKKRPDPLALSIKDGRQRLVLCHYPWAAWPKGAIMLHGHSHGNAVEKASHHKMRVDVGVDCWDFHPVSLEEVICRVYTRCAE